MTIGKQFGRAVELLLVEDNPGDVRLLQECLKESDVDVNLNVATDGVTALRYLRREPDYSQATRPDVILLDLNLPGKDGREVLAEIKRDEQLAAIPTIVLTTSESAKDIAACYKLKANCYVKKPVHFEEFVDTVRELQRFWFTVAQLPIQRPDTR